MLTNPLSNDLDYILKHTVSLWEELRDQRIFITGGTGFFGCWLLESFVWANQKLNLNANAFVLTRNISAFAKNYLHLIEQPSLHFYEGDVRSFEFPQGEFSHIIHAATDANAQLNETNPLLMLDTIVQGTKHTLAFARQCRTKCFLLTSSGAVYGKQPPDVSHLSEDYPCQPKLDDAKSAYAVGKCMAEHICCLFALQYGLNVKIARCFAFVGPYLPLDIHFAIGNFIRDGLNGGPIVVNGDGTSYRSYLYAADLAIWLWTILFRGHIARPYNVGSEQDFSISELAHFIANYYQPSMTVTIAKKAIQGQLPARYVPNVQRAFSELALPTPIPLKEAITRTIGWHMRNK